MHLKIVDRNIYDTLFRGMSHNNLHLLYTLRELGFFNEIFLFSTASTTSEQNLWTLPATQTDPKVTCPCQSFLQVFIVPPGQVSSDWSGVEPFNLLLNLNSTQMCCR